MGYRIKADGSLLFVSDAEVLAHIALNPKLTLDVNSAGALAFVLPPGNALHRKLQKLKNIVTVEHDGAEIFRGRVLDEQTDIYNQISVYCEGQKAFLLDSQIAPYTFSGTAEGLFGKLISDHNSKVDANKRFTVGNVTVAAKSKAVNIKTNAWATASSEIEERLLNAYGGYLRARTVGNTHYIDWVEQYGESNSQPIEFSVNLLELNEKIDAGAVFTVLIPLGESTISEDGEYTEPVSVASVNGGLNYIQDDEAVARYGKIWRTRTWSYESDPAELLKKAREHLKTGIALETLTLKAVDMHFVNGNVQPIRLGDRVRIISNPHGVDKTMVCSRIEIDLLNPENTEYTFGEQVRTLTENVVRTEEQVEQLTGHGGGGGGRKSVEEEVSDIIRWAKIRADENEAYIQLTAGELDKANKRLSAAEIEIDGVNAQVTLAASRMDDLEQRTSSAEIAIDGVEADIRLHAESISDLEGLMTQAEIAIDGLEAEITLKASKKSVDDLTSRVSQAEIDIDGAEAAIKLKANQTTVDNLTKRVSTAEIDIDGAQADIKLHAESISDLEGLMTQAEIDIDGLNAEIILKVSKDGVVSAINQTAETILIKASKINLSGYVTASQLSAEIADINLNMANTVATDTLRASSAIISFLTFQDTYCTLKSGDFVTSVTFPVYQEANLYYLDWDGNKQSKLVLLPTKNTVGSYAKNKDYKYIGA